MSVTLRRQVALFARDGEGHVRLVVWTGWDAKGRARSEMIVWQVVRTLLPRDRVAQQVAHRVADVELVDVDAWLASKGYGVIGRLEGPELDEPLTG